jgi:hypothetical protein
MDCPQDRYLSNGDSDSLSGVVNSELFEFVEDDIINPQQFLI